MNSFPEEEDVHAKAQRRKARREELPENVIARDVVSICYAMSNELGPGLLESVYEVVLAMELSDLGYQVERQVDIPIRYRNLQFEIGFRADIIVNGLVILEIKSVEETHRAFKKQVLTYLRLTNMRLGLLINFGDVMIKNNIHRIVNGLPDE